MATLTMRGSGQDTLGTINCDALMSSVRQTAFALTKSSFNVCLVTAAPKRMTKITYRTVVKAQAPKVPRGIE